VSPDKKKLATYGPRGATVRVYELSEETVRVEWYDGPKGHKIRRTKDWPNTGAARTEAKAWAKGFSEQRTLPRAQEQITLRTLFERYATAEFEHLRPRTRQLYREHWRYWERMWRREFLVEQTTLEMVDQFRSQLRRRKRPLAISSIGKAITTIKQVYRWGRLRGHLLHNPIGDYVYKVAKNDRPKPVPEYSDAEFGKIMAALDTSSGSQWRAFVGLSLCGWQGVRENAAVHLQWADIDERTDTLTWRGEWDKMGNTWTQPLRAPTKEALAVARHWREQLGYTGPWVLPGGSSLSKRDGSYSPQSLIAALRTAEHRSGVSYIRGRGPHSLRRLLAGEVAAATKDPLLAMRSIGDTDIRQANRYILERQDPIRDAFLKLDALRTKSEAPPEHPHSTASQPDTTTGTPQECPSEPTVTQGVTR
jgi:integrase